MNPIIIDKRDLDFLVSSQLPADLVAILNEKSSIFHNSVSVTMERDAVGKVLEFLGDELNAKGFSSDDEPNGYGIMIEGLIDKFSRNYYPA